MFAKRLPGGPEGELAFASRAPGGSASEGIAVRRAADGSEGDLTLAKRALGGPEGRGARTRRGAGRPDGHVTAYEAAAILAGPHRYGSAKALIFVQLSDKASLDVGKKARGIVDAL
ncbi:MAG TPA: hypothetical protein VF316_08550 [Polyangiaceae bacterium]